MKAIVLKKHGESKSAFEIQQRPDPAPSEGQILIEVEYSGLNFADVMARLGMYPDAPPMPSVLGYDVVGRIAKLGPGVQNLRPGARVVAFTRFGGYANLLATPSQGAVEIPENWDGAAATALATQGCTAWFCAEEMVRIHESDHVLIHAAAGGVGSILVQLARRHGATIYGTAGSDAKLARLREEGVHHPINYREKDFAKECMRLTQGRGVDLIFDSLGGSVFRKGMKILTTGGRAVLFGVAEAASSRKTVLPAGLSAGAKMVKALASFGILHPIQLLSDSKSVIGVNMLRVADRAPGTLARCLDGVVSATKKGELILAPATVFKAEDVAQAHDALASRKTVGKLALKWS